MAQNTDDILLGYMLGLPSDEDASADEAVRKELDAARHALGALTEHMEPVKPGAGLRARLFDSLVETCRFEDFADPIAKILKLSRERTLDYLRKIDEPKQWESGPFPGVSLLHIDAGPGLEEAITGFVKLDAGAQFPEHRHLGEERIYVLQGRYHDSLGRTYGPGEYVVQQPGTEHHLDVPDDGVNCIYLAVVDRGVSVGGTEILYDSPLL